jgi:hypothetical protein
MSELRLDFAARRKAAAIDRSGTFLALTSELSFERLRENGGRSDQRRSKLCSRHRERPAGRSRHTVS